MHMNSARGIGHKKKKKKKRQNAETRTPKRDPNRAYIFPNFRVSTPPYKFSKQIMENIPYSISFGWIYFINSLFHFISKGVLCVSTLLRQLLQHATPSRN